jgi:hypothetical protein
MCFHVAEMYELREHGLIFSAQRIGCSPLQVAHRRITQRRL